MLSDSFTSSQDLKTILLYLISFVILLTLALHSATDYYCLERVQKEIRINFIFWSFEITTRSPRIALPARKRIMLVFTTFMRAEVLLHAYIPR